MTTEELESEFEKRIHTLQVNVHRVWRNHQNIEVVMDENQLEDIYTVYCVTMSGINTFVMRRIPATRMINVRPELTKDMLDTVARELLHSWVMERYLVKEIRKMEE